MDVRAVYELPVPVWVMRDALGQSYPTSFRSTQFRVVLPADVEPVGAAPAVEGIEARPEFEDVSWAQEFSSCIPESLKPATALLRVAIDEVDGPIPEHNPWFDPAHQVAEYVAPWFDAVRTWAEIFTGQDLDPDHRVYDAVMVGAGLTFIEPPRDSPLGMQLSTPRIRPLRAREWALILDLVSQGKEPPVEEVLSRDARAAQRRSADRRAIIEAATAVEIVLGRHVRAVADQLPETQRRRITERSALGDYIAIAKDSHLELAVSIDDLKLVKDLRNDAAHRGETPSHGWDTGRVVQIMIDFLSEHGLYRRTGEIEPDGSEWVVLEENE